MINAGGKVWCVFRLSKQRWSNRGDQKSDIDGGYLLNLARDMMANWCTTIALILLFIVTMQYANIVNVPSYEMFISAIRSLK